MIVRSSCTWPLCLLSTPLGDRARTWPLAFARALEARNRTRCAGCAGDDDDGDAVVADAGAADDNVAVAAADAVVSDDED